MSRAIKYSQAELSFLKKNCTLSRRELTVKFNKKFNRNLQVGNIKAICTRNQWLTGRTGHFKVGSQIWKNRVSKPNSGSFKKGNAPRKKNPLGHERIHRNGMIEVKVAEPKVYQFKQRTIWEKLHGPVPEGFVVTFKDGNNRNFVPSNLELISRLELLKRNTLDYKNQHISLKPTIALIAKLETNLIRASQSITK